MDGDAREGDILTSWKEIARYLRRDVRTCLRWEKNYGLPVHRLDPTSERSRVFAYRTELDVWLRESSSAKSAPQPRFTRAFLLRSALYLLLPLMGAGAVLLYYFLRQHLSPGEPADFSIRGSTLLVLNEKGRELWRYDTGLDNLSEREYRAHFQVKAMDDSGVALLPYLLIRDIDGDGRKEVLFSIQTLDESNEGGLICLDYRGRIFWPFKAGRRMRFGGREYSGDYRIRGILAEDLDNDGKREVLVCAVHRPDWPCQLVLLDPEGNKKGEFWNGGHFVDFAFIDLDDDGKKEVIAAGVNNEYGRGCVVVFNSDRVEGGSPQMSVEYQCPDLGPGSAKYYLLLPRTDVDLSLHSPAESIVYVGATEDRRLFFRPGFAWSYFELSYNLDSPDLIFGHDFMQKHAQARLEGRIKSVLNDAYKADLLKGILYWDGDKWTAGPTMNLR